MADSGDVPEKKGGCFSKLVGLLLFVVAIGVGAAVVSIVQPQDLTDLEGRGPGVVGEKSRDLPQVMKNALEGGYALTLTEKEINLYLRDTLKAEQGGFLADQVKIRDVAVRLEEDRAEVIIERDVAGQTLTLSMYLRVEQTELPDGRVTTEIFRNGGLYHESLPRPSVGGRFGQLPVPEGFLHLVLPSFTKLASVYRSESEVRSEKALDFIDDMARIRIEEGKLVMQSSPSMPGIPSSSGP